MRHASLFSGIGGFDLAADWMGWENVFHCDINPFGKKVLEYYYPNSISYGDITKTDFTIHRGDIDVLSGGFPCQPYSLAGKRKGKDDERHLFPEMLRAIREISPRWIIGENVYGLVNWDGGLVFHEVQSDLEAEGYEVFPYVLPACAINAPHRRDRVFFIAYSDNPSTEYSIQARRNVPTSKDDARTSTYSNDIRCNERNGEYAEQSANRRLDALNDFSQVSAQESSTDSDGIGLRSESHRIRKSRFISKNDKTNYWETFPTVPPICDGDDGLSDRLDSIAFSKWRKQSIMAGGNAVVPQLIYVLFKTISKFEELKTKQC
jgi:DNA (cytosine-5)-methyltransferase 1